MANVLRNLQRGILPNIPILRKLIPWYDAVSDFIDVNGKVVAAMVIDGGGNIQRRFGFTTTVAHPSAGNFTLEFDQTLDPNKLYPVANIYSPSSPPNGAINIYPTIADATHINIAIWQIAATTAVRSQVDEEFCVVVWQAPT